MAGPVLVTDRTARPSFTPVLTSTLPPATLWRTALVSRLATSRSTSRESPSRVAGSLTSPTWIPSRSVSGRRPVRVEETVVARSTGSCPFSPLSLLAKVSRASIRRACSSLEASTSWAVQRQSAVVVPGSSSATWRRVRSAVKGVRSSWEALATKCRWASKAASSRAKRPSRVSPSSLSSSCGPSRARRSCRLVEEILRAVRVMVRMGRSIRPATSQPARRASAATMARAIPELTRSWCASAARCAAWTVPAWAS